MIDTMRDLSETELHQVGGGDGFGDSVAIGMIGHGLWVVTGVINCGPDPSNCSTPASSSCGTHGILCA